MTKRTPEKTGATTNKKRETIKKLLLLLAAVLIFSMLLFAFVEIGIYISHRRSETTSGGYDIGLLYYNALTMKQKKLYDNVVDAAKKCDEYSEVLPYSYSESDIQTVLRFIRAEHPELFYTDFSAIELHSSLHKSMVKMAYLSTPAEIDAMTAELERRVSDIAARCTASDSYGIELFLHDTLIAECTSRSPKTDDDPIYSTAYGALVLGEAYCEGYAQAYQVLLSKAGIYSCIVYGSGTSGEDLAWNLITDGADFCHTDVLWDDPDASDDSDFALHGYFKLGYDDMTVDHIPQDPDVIPSSPAIVDYYSEEELTAQNAEELKSILVTLLGHASENGDRYIELNPVFSPTEDTLRGIFEEAVSEVNASSAEGSVPLRGVLDTYPISERGGGTVFKLYY